MLPLLVLDPYVERKSRRNALTSGVAAAFPFASYELSDRNGIFLGLDLYNRSPVFLDPYDDYKQQLDRRLLRSGQDLHTPVFGRAASAAGPQGNSAVGLVLLWHVHQLHPSGKPGCLWIAG